jgi:hypothetical protein
LASGLAIALARLPAKGAPCRARLGGCTGHCRQKASVSATMEARHRRASD